MEDGSIHDVVTGGELLAQLYRLSRNSATGIATVARPTTRATSLVLARGQLIVSARDEGRTIVSVLRRLTSEPRVHLYFEGGEALYPAGHRRVALDAWAFAHLERSLSGSGAAALATELAGLRIAIREELAPDPALLDETGRRLIAALTSPLRADELPTVARAPRFRTLAFLFALDKLGALEHLGVAATVARADLGTASRALGLEEGADRVRVKRAYRRLARALHPDLASAVPSSARRARERKLADVNRAYRLLLRG